jgi:SAM-dependent methyltransferase
MTTDWEKRWQAGQTGWDLGAVSPPLAAYIDQIPDSEKHLPILIPGCGSAYEAAYLLDKGFEHILMLDLAPTAVEHVKRRMDKAHPDWSERMEVRTGDFFELQGHFHRILEQTFFCAIDPGLRPKYVHHMHQLLLPEGRLSGVLFNRDFEGGPPFGGSTPEYRILFEPLFHLHTLEPCYNSVPPRAGTEVFLICKPR